MELRRGDEEFPAYLCLSTDLLSPEQTEGARFLNAEEQEYCATLSFERRRHSFLLGRYCAKHALCAFLEETNPCVISIQSGVFSQPVVRHPAKSNVQVSIAHSAMWGSALAFPESHPMGIDIEVIRPARTHVIQTQITADEQALLQQLPHPEATRLTLLWTVKEALSKTIKTGMMTPFDVFELDTMDAGGRFVVSTFKKFGQYKALSFLLNNAACSIVCPKNTSASLNLENLPNA